MSNEISNSSSEDTLSYLAKKQESKFIRQVVHEGSLASSRIKSEAFNLEDAKTLTKEGFASLSPTNGLQTMLSAQLLSTHHLQQESMMYANLSDSLPLKQYFTNTAIKLANCFVQQANLLAKLQGGIGQKIIVERVDVSNGGQAVIGNINAPDRA